MASIFESNLIKTMAAPFRVPANRFSVVFPNLEWDLKKAGFVIDVTQYLAIIIYITLVIFILSTFILVVPIILISGINKAIMNIALSLFITATGFIYLLFLPKSRIAKRRNLIDKDLEYMLKDIRIQLSSGVPLFDTMVNVARGQYGECSNIASGIIQEVHSGRAIVEVLDNVGMWSPSEYLRKVLWQIVNAVKSGSDVGHALDAIADDIRADKEAKIKSYGQELNLWSLLYMIGTIVMPSMGVTLLVILSSFFGGAYINESILWIILIGLMLFQTAFLLYVKSRRPNV